MTTPFQYSRLTYRAVETPDDNTFFQALQQDPLGYANSNFSISKPQSKNDATKYQKDVAEDSMMGVVFCLGAPDTTTPIGCLHLTPLRPAHARHRHSTLAIDVLPEYQGQGYGTEAFQWALQWAFETRGLHRVSIAVFGYNEGAKRLYERLGFVVEGCRREFVWFQGKWWDDFQMGMLEREWRERYWKSNALDARS
jgi:RimJ/RimL family protein N-acetyltransferase